MFFFPPKNKHRTPKSKKTSTLFTPRVIGCTLLGCGLVYLFGFSTTTVVYKAGAEEEKKDSKGFFHLSEKVEVPVLDTVDYDRRMILLANYPVITPPASSTASTTKPVVHPWPAKTVRPNVGAILPFKRIIAYYGNLYSTKMGVLGEYPEDQMIAMLKAEVQKWTDADPTTPAIPALHYIVTTAQGSAGADGKYRFRMPKEQIDKVMKMAEKSNALVFLDVQVALSNLQAELPILEPYLKLPNVHLGIDPEFSMKFGDKPGSVIGTMDATDINYATDYLAKLVKENNLPPKILIVHRFTYKMVTNYKQIKTPPEVQIVMDMDGWGTQAKKIGTYTNIIAPEPVQFTGFKLFYKNDLKTPSTGLLTPAQVLKLKPRPIYIQYQ